MMKAKLALAITLVGCGRLGFDEIGDDDVPGPIDTETITLVVMDDTRDAQSRGAPIPGATVLVDRGGDFERTVTDDQGTAEVAAAGVVALHVAIRFGAFWQVYTVVSPPSGVIELGNREVGPQDETTMTVALPDTGVRGYDNDFSLQLPQSCALQVLSMLPTVALDYDRACEGKTVRILAYSWPPDLSKQIYLDLGDVTLATGSTLTASGSFGPLPIYDVAVTHVPAAVIQSGGWFTANLFAHSDLGITQLDTGGGPYTMDGETMTLSVSAARGGNMLEVEMIDFAHGSLSMRVVPVTDAPRMTFDARTLLAPFESLVLGSPASVAWTGGDGQGTLISAWVRSDRVSWTAYAPPSVTGVSFPELPADLGVPILSSFRATVMRLELAGTTTADLVRTVDRVLVSSDVLALSPPREYGRTFIQADTDRPVTRAME